MNAPTNSGDYHEAHLVFSEIGKGKSRMIVAKCSFGHVYSGIAARDFSGSYFEAMMSDRNKVIRCEGALPHHHHPPGARAPSKEHGPMARLHNFSDEAIAAIMTRHGQPQRYGRSRQNLEAVRLISQQAEIDRREQSDLLATALIEARPELPEARRVACEIRQANGWMLSDTDHAVNELKRWRRAQRQGEGA